MGQGVLTPYPGHAAACTLALRLMHNRACTAPTPARTTISPSDVAACGLQRFCAAVCGGPCMQRLLQRPCT